MRGYSMPVLGLPCFAGRADQTESPKTAIFYPVAFRQGLAHPVKNRLDHKLDIFDDELREACGEPDEDFGTAHVETLPYRYFEAVRYVLIDRTRSTNG